MNAFAFTSQSITPASLARELADPAAGGFASFEGWVRNHNEGREVTRLEYEAFESLAIKEGERIVAQAHERFPILKAACVHRIGSLAIGELAVWVGVSARHRDEAFRACRYIIDEIKHRVPIWKKEHYAQGDSGWVNCERCALPTDHGEHHAHHQESTPAKTHKEPPRPDYSRQIALREVGVAGQEGLRRRTVLVIGAGGLGVPVLSYLAAAGVGTLIIVDADHLEASNLHRQPLYTLDEVGQPKAELAAARLRALNPDVKAVVHVTRFAADNARELVAGCDLALDCSDNFATKFLLNDACVLERKPAIFASVYQYEGQLQAFRPEDPASPCLRCLWPQATRDGIVGNCEQAGVLGPVPGVLGSLQALEALKMLLGLPGQLRDELAVVDLSTLSVQRLRSRRHEACRDGACARIIGLSVPEELELSFASLTSAGAQGFDVIDIRDTNEVRSAPADPAQQIPMEQLLTRPEVLDAGRRYLLLCARGARSLAAATELRSKGYKQIFSLRGGVAGLKQTGA